MKARVLLLPVLAAGCAAHYQTWAESRTRNVSVYTQAKLEHEFMQEWLERSYTAYQAFFPDLHLGKVTAVWLKDEPGSGTRVFSPLDDPPSGWTLETVPSGGRIGRDGLIVLERRDSYTASRGTFRAHSTRDARDAKLQMAHLFIMHAVPNAPLWLQVGLGRYLSKYQVHYKGDLFLTCFGGPVFDEPIRLDGGSFEGGGRRVSITVDQLFHTDWYRYDSSLRHWYEHTAYALVHYLIHGENGFHTTRFPVFLKALRDGMDTEDALALAYPHILPDEWDAKLDAYMRPPERRSLTGADPHFVHGLCFRTPAEHDADFKPTRRPVDPHEIEVLLDDLERVDPFRRHVGWFPTDIVEAEASKRPPRVRPAPGPQPPPTPDDHAAVPTVRTTAPP
jgi:hypothetical protein